MTKVTPIPRRKKKEKNIAVELMKIVLGGVAGLLIGFFLLLWVWKKDILNVAPKFPAWAQWALPADLRKAPPNVTPISTAPETSPQSSAAADPDAPAETPPDAMPDESSPKQDQPADSDAPKDASESDDPAKKEVETEKPVVPADNEDTPAEPGAEKKPDEKIPDETKPDIEPAQPKKEKPIDTDDPLDITPPDADKKVDEPKIDIPKIDEPKIDEPKIEEPKIEEPKTDEPKVDEPKVAEPKSDDPFKEKTTDEEKPKPDEEKPKPDDEPTEPKTDEASEVGLKVAEAATQEQVETAVKTASDAFKTLTPSDAAQKSAFTPQKYAAFGNLCEAVATVARAGAGAAAADELKATLLAATGEEEHATVIGQLANAWLARARKNDGILLVGKVEEVSADGPLKTAKIQLPALGTKLPAMQVTVVSKDLPKLNAGDSIDIAGVIVEKPAEAIAGFKGENNRVIWATHINPRAAKEPAEPEKTDEKPAE
jgi:hypothetical protein